MLEANDDLAGQTLLGKLRVIRRLGAGGMGVVYEVEHLLTRHRRALKVIRPELSSSVEGVARLVREAGVAGRLESPFVVETYDVGRLDDGSTYILMELLEGRSLRALLSEEGPLDGARAARLVAGVCEGLEAVHAAGIIHRDIKPENLFFATGDDGIQRVKILDFGIMKLEEGMTDTFGALTRAGSAAYTPSYMAPEQADEGVALDGRVDVYALGVVLYEALSGQRPFVAATPAALAVRVHPGKYRALAEVAPGVDPALEAVVRRAMSRDREERQASAAELRRALLPFVTVEAGATPPRPLPSRRRRALAGAITLGASASLLLWLGAMHEKLGATPVTVITSAAAPDHAPTAPGSDAPPLDASVPPAPPSSAPEPPRSSPPPRSMVPRPRSVGPSAAPIPTGMY